VLYILQLNENFNFNANKARAIITLFKEYLSPINIVYPAITVAGIRVPLLAKCGYSSINTRDLAHLFLNKIYTPFKEYKREGSEISSFYIKRSRYITFFSLVDLISYHESGP
jgi:hypothetical protein